MGWTWRTSWQIDKFKAAIPEVAGERAPPRWHQHRKELIWQKLEILMEMLFILREVCLDQLFLCDSRRWQSANLFAVCDRVKMQSSFEICFLMQNRSNKHWLFRCSIVSPKICQFCSQIGSPGVRFVYIKEYQFWQSTWSDSEGLSVHYKFNLVCQEKNRAIFPSITWSMK